MVYFKQLTVRLWEQICNLFLLASVEKENEISLQIVAYKTVTAEGCQIEMQIRPSNKWLACLAHLCFKDFDKIDDPFISSTSRSRYNKKKRDGKWWFFGLQIPHNRHQTFYKFTHNFTILCSIDIPEDFWYYSVSYELRSWLIQSDMSNIL